MCKIIFILTSVFILSLHIEVSGQKVFFVDAQNGSDTNSGMNLKKPWKTLNKINTTTFVPGSTIFLKNGQIFHGTLKFDNDDSGSSTSQVTIGGYGKSATPPVIDSGSDAAIILDNVSHVKITGINLHGAGRKTGNTTSGLIMDQCSNVDIDSVRVSGYQQHGIEVLSSENIRITHVKAHDNGRTGIRSGGDRAPDSQDFPTKNIYIGYSATFDNAGDPTIMDNHSGSGIIVSFTDSAVVEYCSSYNNGWDMPRKGNGPVGIWAHDANNVTIQYCISFNNEAPRGAWDGGGFDFDGGITNSVMQYNYSYDNNGAGIGLFQYAGTTVWENNIIRYNISYNDGDGQEYTGIYIWTAEPDKDLLRNCSIYNNVIVNEIGSAIKFAGDNPGNNSDPDGFTFYNNIFIARDEPIKGSGSRSLFSNNAWWRMDGSNINQMRDKNGFYQNPIIAMPGPENYRITDPRQLPALQVFRLLENSPCHGTGKTISDTGKNNFWGEPIASPPNIGAQ